MKNNEKQELYPKYGPYISKHGIRIGRITHDDDGICIAEISARTEDIYHELHRCLSKWGNMELDVRKSDYGYTGVFVTKSEHDFRRYVRAFKQGARASDGEVKGQPLRSQTRKKKRAQKVTPNTQYGVWEMEILVNIR